MEIETLNAIPECSAGLCGNTKICSDDSIVSIETIYNFSVNNTIDTYAISNEGSVVQTKLSPIPAYQLQDIVANSPAFQDTSTRLINLGTDFKMFANEVIDIEFDNGYKLTCTNNTKFMIKRSDEESEDHKLKTFWVTAEYIQNGDVALGISIGEEAKTEEIDIKVTSISARSVTASEAIYLFTSKDENILLPHVSNGKLTMICVHQ